jgi:hypothetical protein
VADLPIAAFPWHVASLLVSAVLLGGLPSGTKAQEAAPPSDSLVISYRVPTDVTDPADLEKSAIFAWNEFIALTWPAAAQGPVTYNREAPLTTGTYGQVGPTGQVVWETFRHKVEIFPTSSTGTPGGRPNGYDPADPDLGYKSAPEYNYKIPITAFGGLQGSTVPFNNLDETTEISLNVMHAGIVLPRDASGATATDKRQKIIFQAKANKVMYKYAVQAAIKNGTFDVANRQTYIDNAKDNFKKNDPTLFARPYTQLPLSNYGPTSLAVGTIEIKAAFRRLGAEDDPSRFYTPPVRYYVEEQEQTYYIDSNNPKTPERWGLVALHIIHKTPHSPSFSYATFGHISNILDANGNEVEMPDGTTKPQYLGVEPFDPALQITPSQNGQPQKVTLTGAGSVNTDTKRLYYRNIFDPVIARPDGTAYTDPVNINRRLFPIPPEITAVNAKSQALIQGTVWANYRLVNIQTRALDITRDQATIAQQEPTYYLANEVVESNATLQHFRGGLTSSGVAGPGVGNGAAMDKLNMYQLENRQVVRYNMGGCMGCHGPQGQESGGDFSVIFARHTLNKRPETVDEDEDELAKRLNIEGKYIHNNFPQGQ